jgi:hypothetical protein
MEFYNFLYKNSNVYMKRKKDKFEKWFEWHFQNIKCQKRTLENKIKIKI